MTEALVAAALHDDGHLRQEALTMALYVSITLIGVLTIAPGEDSADLDVLRTVGGTTIGLAAAHWLAFSLAARLLQRQDVGAVLRQLLVQLGAAAVVAGVATLPVLFLGDDAERQGALYATAALVGMTVLGHSRASGARPPHALTAAAVALALAFGVAALKHVLS